MSSIEEDVNRLKNDNIILRQQVSNLEQKSSVTGSRLNVLEYEHNNVETEVNTLKKDTERCLNIVSEFQKRTVEYIHYLEDRINKVSDIRPILIIGNKEGKKDESNIP